MSANMLEFNDDNFDSDVLNSPVPVLVDFWAPWCGPCKMLAPVIHELADEFAGRVRIGKLNTDNSPRVSSEFAVSAIPTVIVFKNGAIVDRFVGVTPKTKLSSSLDGHIG